MASAPSSTPVVVSVLAANSQQSSSIIAHLLSLGKEFSDSFRLRAIVRDPSKYSSPTTSTQTTSQVDEVVAGDMNDRTSLEQALKDTDVLWALTNPDPTKGIEAEIQQGRTIVDSFLHSARKDAGTRPKPLLLFSSGIDVDAVTGGEIKMVNATSKGRIESYVHSLPKEQQDAFRFTFVHPGMFMQNFTTYQKPTVDDAGMYHFTGAVRRDVQLPFVDITDLGPLVWLLLRTAYLSAETPHAYEQYDRATIRLYGQYLSYPQLVEQFSQATNSPAVYDYMSVARFLSVFFGGTEAEAKAQINPKTRNTDQETVFTMIGDMYNLVNRYGYYGEGAPDYDEHEKDVRMQKIITQQPTRRTTWKEFVQRSFSKNSRGHESASLSLPANFPDISSLSRAEQFLYEHLSYFVRASQAGSKSQADFEQDVLKPNFHRDGVVEFPYFPRGMRGMLGFKPLSVSDEDGAILDGYADILGYFKDWQQTFYFEKGELHSLSALSSSTSRRQATPNGAMIEARLIGTVTQGGQSKPYVQDYLCLAFVDEQGKVVRYQEYWEPSRFT